MRGSSGIRRTRLLALSLCISSFVASTHLSVADVEETLTRPCLHHEPKSGAPGSVASAGVTTGDDLLGSSMWLKAATAYWAARNWRAAATVFADLLEARPGNERLVRFLTMAYSKLYPSGPDPVYPEVPVEEAFADAMRRANTTGTVVDGGRRLFAEVLDPSPPPGPAAAAAPAFPPPGPAAAAAPAFPFPRPRLFVVKGFLEPSEVAALAEAAAEGAAARRASASPVVCLSHSDYRAGSPAFRAGAARNAPFCLRDSPGSRALARRLANHSSVSTALWVTGVAAEGDRVPPPPGAATAGRTAAGSFSHSGPAEMDALVLRLEARVEAVTGLEAGLGMGHQLLAYQATGSGYHAHTDCDEGAGVGGLGDRGGSFEFVGALRGVRAFTTLALLSDGFRALGGATVFPRLGLSLKVKAGDLLVWQNMQPAAAETAQPLAAAAAEAAAAEVGAGGGSTPVAAVKPGSISGPRKYRCDGDMLHLSEPIAPAAETAADELSVAAPVEKLAWQRWYGVASAPFLGERHAWTHSVEGMVPGSPVMACDATGRARFHHLADIAAPEATVSCRTYSQWPYPDLKESVEADLGSGNRIVPASSQWSLTGRGV